MTVIMSECWTVVLVDDGSPSIAGVQSLAEQSGWACEVLPAPCSTARLREAALSATLVVVPLTREFGLGAARDLRRAGYAGAIVAAGDSEDAVYRAAVLAGCDDVVDPVQEPLFGVLKALRRALLRREALGARGELLQGPTTWLSERDSDAQALARIGSWEIDLRTRISQCSPELLRIMGLPTDALLDAETLHSRLHPSDREQELSKFSALLLRGTPLESRYRIVHPDGRLLYAVALGRVDVDETGTPIHAYGTLQDVTAQAVAERALEAERGFSAAVLGAVREGYALTRQGVIVEVNDALCTLTGFSRGELVGSRAPYPFWPKHLVEHAQELVVAVHRGETRQVDLPLQRRDGELIECVLSAQPAHDADGDTSGWVTMIEDVTALRDRERSMQRAAQTDAMTGLLNHAAFHAELAHAVETARTKGTLLSLVILDLDHFKRVNDQFGHLAGDEVLRELAERISHTARRGDAIGRTGGEEFAWLMPGTPLATAERAAERLRAAVADLPFSTTRLTASLGVAVLEVSDATPKEFFARADAALYVSKSSGRNRVAASRPIPIPIPA